MPLFRRGAIPLRGLREVLVLLAESEAVAEIALGLRITGLGGGAELGSGLLFRFSARGKV
jgi:hypothetical protein